MICRMVTEKQNTRFIGGKIYVLFLGGLLYLFTFTRIYLFLLNNH